MGSSWMWKHVHVNNAVILHGFVIEPGTIARFPFETADHAEFGSATTRHVVAAFFQFDSSGAIETALPAFLLRNFGKMLCGFVLGARTTGVPFAVANATNFSSAAGTFTILAAAIRAARCVEVDICGFNPFAATSSGAVYSVFGGILLKFLVPSHFEREAEEIINVL